MTPQCSQRLASRRKIDGPHSVGSTDAALTNQTMKESEMAAANIRTCTVYGLCSDSDSSIRYVGQTVVETSSRLRQHIKRSRISKRPVHRDYWIRSVLNCGGSICLVVLQENAVWNDSERLWIEKLKAEGASLTNATAGGEGMLDAPEELKARIRATVKKLWENDEYRQKAAGSRKGVPWSEAQRNARYAVSSEVRSERGRKSRSHLSKERLSEIGSFAAKEAWKKRRENGTDCGVHTNTAKLDDAKVVEIRSRHKNGEQAASLAREFGMSPAGIRKVIYRKTWKHVA